MGVILPVVKHLNQQHSKIQEGNSDLLQLHLQVTESASQLIVASSERKLERIAYEQNTAKLADEKQEISIQLQREQQRQFDFFAMEITVMQLTGERNELRDQYQKQQLQLNEIATELNVLKEEKVILVNKIKQQNSVTNERNELRDQFQEQQLQLNEITVELSGLKEEKTILENKCKQQNLVIREKEKTVIELRNDNSAIKQKCEQKQLDYEVIVGVADQLAADKANLLKQNEEQIRSIENQKKENYVIRTKYKQFLNSIYAALQANINSSNSEKMMTISTLIAQSPVREVDNNAIEIASTSEGGFEHSSLKENTNGKIICDVCQKSFKKTYCLKRHMRIHSGDKPYSCQKCQSKFTQSSHLKKHLKTHNRDN